MEQITVYLKLNDPLPIMGFVLKGTNRVWNLTGLPLRIGKDVAVLDITARAFVRLAAFTFKETLDTKYLSYIVSTNPKRLRFCNKLTLICDLFFSSIYFKPIAYELAKAKLLELYNDELYNHLKELTK